MFTEELVSSLFLKTERDSTDRMEFGNSFHHLGTTEESLAADLRPFCDDFTRRLSLAERSEWEGT